MADPLSLTGTAVGIVSLGIQVAQSLFDYYNALKSQDSDILYTKKKLHSLLEILECLRSRVNDRRFRANEQGLVQKIESHIRECEDCIQELKEEAKKFEKTPVTSFQSTVTSTLRRAAYPFRKSTLQKLSEDVDDITLRLKLALQLLQQEVVDRVSDDIEDVKALLSLVRASQISSELQDWLVQGAEFSSWLGSPKSFLWLRGFAGCGKSVLCSTAIEYAFRHRRSDPKVGVAFFFFTFNDEGKQSASAMLRALILQLSSQQDSHGALSHLHSSYRHASPPDEALLGCLHQLVRVFRNVYILVDALDERPRNKHREMLLQVLEDMRAWEEPGLHLLITSRNEIDIRDGLQANPEETLEMRNSKVDQDIAAFIGEHLQESRQLRKWKKHHDRIQKTLTDRANGVLFKTLANCPVNQYVLDKLLQSLPRSLDETYARMLGNIAPELQEYARQMLTVLCCAVRPLTDLELINALAFDLADSPRFDPARTFEDVDGLQDICPGFTEISINTRTGETTIRIAHFSVQEYLESERFPVTGEISLFRPRRQDGHAHIASICLALLLEPQIRGMIDRDEIISLFPLAEYAARYWHTHTKQGTPTEGIEAQLLQLFRLTNVSTLNTWVRIWNVDHPSGKWATYTALNPIYYAARLGLGKVLSRLLNEDCPMDQTTLSPMALELINAKGGGHGTALHAAAYNGHGDTVNILLDRGADIDMVGRHYGSALQAASANGNEKIVQILLNRGADINMPGGHYGSALQAAIVKGHEKIVQMLLEKGATTSNLREKELAKLKAMKLPSTAIPLHR
ncbi:hypothetical protein GGS24DRAFT_512427 [Hypoxylon argillaceum]|nr:hypothetical protein GGS24DRAFT_512427 [Hypoxylon argillaceum]